MMRRPDLEDPGAPQSPPDWDAVFGRSGPLELEIGSGKGGFAVGFGLKHPARRLVAVEVRKKYAEMTARRIETRQVANVLVLRADIKASAARLFSPGALAAIHLYFPDPWWKRRHFKRRVVDPAFAAAMLGLLAPGGLLHVRTDVERRAHDMLAVLTDSGFENAVGPGVFAPFDPEEVPTSREIRYLAHGEPVWRLRLRRPA